MTPKTFIRRVGGMVYDYNNNLFTAKEALEYLTALVKEYHNES
jgi:hypothetical protein